jgi:hypothetical protein
VARCVSTTSSGQLDGLEFTSLFKRSFNHIKVLILGINCHEFLGICFQLHMNHGWEPNEHPV